MALAELIQGLLTALAVGLLAEGVVLVYQLATASDSRIYAKVLRDQYGAWVEKLLDVGAVEWHSRGPMQFIRLRPVGRLNPLSKDELTRAFEAQTSGWLRRALEVLRTEATLEQHGAFRRSPHFVQFLEQLYTKEPPKEASELALVRGGESGREAVREFFVQWDGITSDGKPITKDGSPARALLHAFRANFFPELIAIDTSFDKLMTTYALERYRRGVRQRLIIAAVIVGSVMVVRANPDDFAGGIVMTAVRFVIIVILATLVATIVSRFVMLTQAGAKHGA
jgi:hypothetical protein